MKKHEIRRASRWAKFKLLMLVALVIVAIRIALVTSPEGDTAFLSANDRSRWCTVACLVQHGTYAIDKVIAITDPSTPNRHPWQTIDKVQHRAHNGELRYYSSKPPLFPTMVAGVYWCMYTTTGFQITEHPIWIPRIILWLVNLPLFGICLWSMTLVIDHLCRNSWAKYTAVTAACFGTMLLPFSISLNNHLPAAAAIAVATAIYFYAAETLDDDYGICKSVHSLIYLLAGLAIGVAVANELPALSMAVLFAGLFFFLEKKSLLPVFSGSVLVAVAFFGTNLLAHRSIRPPYAHRGNGKVVDRFFKEAGYDSTLSTQQSRENLIGDIESRMKEVYRLAESESIELTDSNEPGRFRIMTPDRDLALLDKDTFWELRTWDDWYEYPGSYWQEGRRKGVDLGEPSRFTYLFHMTFGHHGIFSLTPIFLLIPLGVVRLCMFGPTDLMRFSIAVVIASVVCIGFYTMRPLIDRNYGGVSVCFRWLLWFIPLWIPMVAVTLDDWSQLRWFRILATVLIALSVISMASALPSPWQDPWLYRFWSS